MVMGGWKALSGVFPRRCVCGVTFAGTQFLVSNFIGPELTDILASLAALGSLVILLKVWKPKDKFQLPGDGPVPPRTVIPIGEALHGVVAVHPAGGLRADLGTAQTAAEQVQHRVRLAGPAQPGSEDAAGSVKPAPYDAKYSFDWLSASGTACLIAAILSAIVLRMSPGSVLQVLASTARQLIFAELTIATVLGLAFLMNYSGATATMGLAFAATGAMFPFFSALLGWLGVFLTGSDTSANALFGNLQVVTAQHLNMKPR